MFEQNKTWVKFRGIFKGLHRHHERAKRPNQLVEYDMPLNHKPEIKQWKPDQKTMGAEIEFDPCAMLEAEFEEDEKRERDMMEKIYGKAYANEQQKLRSNEISRLT